MDRPSSGRAPRVRLRRVVVRVPRSGPPCWPRLGGRGPGGGAGRCEDASLAQLEPTAGLDVERLVDRLVRHPHLRIVGEVLVARPKSLLLGKSDSDFNRAWSLHARRHVGGPLSQGSPPARQYPARRWAAARASDHHQECGSPRLTIGALDPPGNVAELDAGRVRRRDLLTLASVSRPPATTPAEAGEDRHHAAKYCEVSATPGRDTTQHLVRADRPTATPTRTIARPPGNPDVRRTPSITQGVALPELAPLLPQPAVWGFETGLRPSSTSGVGDRAVPVVEEAR